MPVRAFWSSAIMLTINEISVTNFRSIRSERFDLLPLTILVGKNDVGKSNLLGAMQLLFEGTATSVDAEDFYNPAEPLEISAVLAGVSDYLPLCDERNRTKIEQRLDEHGLMIIRRIAPSPRKLGNIEVRDPNSGEFGTPTGIDAAMKPWLPEVIFIAALADVAQEAKGTQKDALGQLVGQVLSAITDQVQPRLDEAYERASRLLNVRTNPDTGAEEDERTPEIAGIERDITRNLNETFPKASVRLKIRLPSVKSIMGQIDVSIKEGAHEDPYYRRGHG